MRNKKRDKEILVRVSNIDKISVTVEKKQISQLAVIIRQVISITVFLFLVGRYSMSPPAGQQKDASYIDSIQFIAKYTISSSLLPANTILKTSRPSFDL